MLLTIADVAEAAGVSAATVDRALNGRPGVHARTRNRVMRAAQRIGYVEPVAAVAASRVRLAFVVPGGSNTFLGLLAGALAASGTATTQVTVHRLDTYRPQGLADGLRRLAADADGIGVVALDHPTVREAIRDLATQGKRVLTLVSDIADVPRAAYVGIDNRAAGRLAGQLLGRLLRTPTGEVAVFAGSLSYRGHEEREMGFRRVCAEDFPELSLLPAHEIEDDAVRSYGAAQDVLARHPALCGIYCLGGGTRGIARALEESGRGAQVVFVGHELTEHTRRFLVSGLMDAVIDQGAATEASVAVALLDRAVRGRRSAARAAASHAGDLSRKHPRPEYAGPSCDRRLCRRLA